PATLDDRRSGRAAERFGPGLLPANLSIVAAHGNDERVLVLVNYENYDVVGQHRRHADSINILERSERKPPSFPAAACIAEESEFGKEDVDVVCVGNRSRGGRVVQGMQLLTARTGCFPLP